MRIVLDQGGFRSPELLSYIEDPNAEFYIPDVALEEMLRKNPAYTAERSLSQLRAVVDRTFVCLSVKEAVEWEAVHRRPITAAELVDEEYTEVARVLISGGPPDKFENYMKRFIEMSDQDTQSFDAVKDKQLLVGIVSNIKSRLQKAGVRALGKTSLEEELGIVLAMSDGVVGEISDFIGEMGRRKRYSDLLYALRWVKNHGIDTAASERIAHDAFDAEYVITGTFYDKLLSGDQKMMPYDSAMRVLCDTSRHPLLLASARALESRLFGKNDEEPRNYHGDEGLQVLRFFGSHLVALCIVYHRAETPDVPEFSAFSGTLLQIDDTVVWLSAGHVVEEVAAVMEDQSITVDECVLADAFGSAFVSERPVPLNFVSARRTFVYDEALGLDFGAVELHPHQVRLLKTNGVRILKEENWAHQDNVTFDGYALLGLPDEFSSKVLPSDGRVEVSPTMITIRELEQPPPGSAKPYRRLVARILDPIPLESVVGMSGGPVIGFSISENVRYWIVALQSTWLEGSRTTFACPFPVFGPMLTEWVRSLDENPEALTSPNRAPD